jgi:hypothetical protein
MQSIFILMACFCDYILLCLSASLMGSNDMVHEGKNHVGTKKSCKKKAPKKGAQNKKPEKSPNEKHKRKTKGQETKLKQEWN